MDERSSAGQRLPFCPVPSKSDLTLPQNSNVDWIRKKSKICQHCLLLFLLIWELLEKMLTEIAFSLCSGQHFAAHLAWRRVFSAILLTEIPFFLVLVNMVIFP